MASKEELLQSIIPAMKLSKAFFLKIYGYDISYPGFSEKAIIQLEKCGCSNARTYYERIVGEYEDRRLNGYTDAEGNKHEGIKGVSAWYVKECDKRYEDYRKSHQGKAVENWKNQKSNSLMKQKEKLLDLIEKIENH